jgi:hypothetical protein
MPDTIPPFPTIDSLNWAPPAQTNPVEISHVDNARLMIYADADNANYQNYVLDVPASSGAPRLNNWWSGHEPQGPRRLVLRQFWKAVPGTFTHLSDGTKLQQSWQYTHGVSTTDSESITAQVGIEGDGLSAGLSATFSHSVTVSEQTTQTTQFSVDPPAQGTRVWILWDLMYEMMVVTQNGGIIIPTGTYRGDVDFADDKHYSGAYLNYKWTHLIVSSGNLFPQDKVFAS